MAAHARVGHAVIEAFAHANSAAINDNAARSTMFLMGPCNQLKKMLEQGRWIASTVYLVSIAATLAVAFTLKGVLGGVLVLVLLVVQLACLVWYCSTYVPGGQGLLGRMVGIK
jgi:hypothetical protein